MSTHDNEHEQATTPEGVPIIQGPDGISELDNPMPRWMAMVFWGTILWGVGYIALFPGVGLNWLGYSQYKVYEAEVADAKARYASAEAADPAALLASALGDAKAIASGKAVYTSSCAACHGTDGGGAIGPNLKDATWVYGSEPEKIAHTIGEGTAKGMPPFKASLSPAQLAELTAYVHSLGKQ